MMNDDAVVCNLQWIRFSGGFRGEGRVTCLVFTPTQLKEMILLLQRATCSFFIEIEFVLKRHNNQNVKLSTVV